MIKMRKILLLLFVVFCGSMMLSAQSIDVVTDGRHYYNVSPNGRYYVGTVEEGPGCFFDSYTKEHFVSDIDSVSISAVNNLGYAYGSYNGQPAVWVQGGEWKILTALDEISSQPVQGGSIRGMSSDATKFIANMYYGNGKMIPVFFEIDKFENWDNKEKWSFSTLPTPSKKDLLYNMAPQYLQVCGMNDDATRILGRYVLVDGKRQVPFIWERNSENKWDIKFVAERCLFIDDVINGTIVIPEKGEGLTKEELAEYDAFRQTCEKGIIYDMSAFVDNVWTGKGRYIPMSANVAVEESVEGVFYAAVIDIDKDTLIIFDAVPNAGTVSVNNRGEVLIYTPQLALARQSYVASVEEPSKATRLYEYTSQRSNGVIDLTKYTKFQVGEDFYGNPSYEILDGSAVWATEGDAFVTYTYDEMNETKLPHCLMVNFLGATYISNVNVEQLAIYPNPTTGVVYFDKKLENVAIYDVACRKVYEQSVAEQSIDLSNLTQGTYIITASFEGENIISKVIITR